MHLINTKLARKYFAFTLAEVLITLGIIGVVAAITIPTLINSYQNTQYVTAYKKFYTSMNQALVQMATDAGCTGDLQCTGILDNGGVGDNTADQKLATELFKYLKVSKDCGTATTGDCWAAYNTKYDGSGGTYNHNTDIRYKILTADGMSVYFFSQGDNCATSMGTGPYSKYCGNMNVDINGLKGPNRLGRDVFYGYIVNGTGPAYVPRGLPAQINNWHTASNCQSSNTVSAFCGGRIIEEGWQMNY